MIYLERLELSNKTDLITYNYADDATQILTQTVVQTVVQTMAQILPQTDSSPCTGGPGPLVLDTTSTRVH